MDVAYYSLGFGPAIQQLTTVVVWIPLQIAALLVYPLFKVSFEAEVKCNSMNHFVTHDYYQVWSVAHVSFGLTADILFLILFICYNVAGHVVVVTTIVNFDLYPVPALILSIEEVIVA